MKEFRIDGGKNLLFILPPAAFLLFSVSGCLSESSMGQPEVPVPSKTPTVSASPVSSGNSTPVAALSLPESTANQELLAASWMAYKARFIQADGRVIDREAGDRSTSEAQAYAMLRAVFVNDPKTFAQTLSWGEKNLQRQVGDRRVDQLWVWKWGRDLQGEWGPIDSNFASDADIDAITALILASRRWSRPEYLNLARAKLQDLWTLSTLEVPGGSRYLLPGPRAAFERQGSIYINPSYLAPYAFRLFAQVDSAHNWLALVDSSYQVLEDSVKLSAVGLPSDWVALDIQGKFQPLPTSSPLQTQYGFDACRVWWRVSLDAAWFQDKRALSFLQQHSKYLQELWRKQKKIPARIDLNGQPIVNYEATSQYAMLYAALRLLDSATAEQILQLKLMPQYHNGIWDNDTAYYTQNLVGLGLLPTTAIPSQLLQVK